MRNNQVSIMTTTWDKERGKSLDRAAGSESRRKRYRHVPCWATSSVILLDVRGDVG